MDNLTVSIEEIGNMNELNISQLEKLIIIIQELDRNTSYQAIYQLLVNNAFDYRIKSDGSTFRLISDLKRDIEPQDNSKYRGYLSFRKYEPNNKGRAVHNLKKLLTYCYNLNSNTVLVTDQEIIDRLSGEVNALKHELKKFMKLSEIAVPQEMKDNITKSLVPTNEVNVYDLDIFSSMKQREKETDLIVTRTYQYTVFSAGLYNEALNLPNGSIIFAKGGDGSTRFVRLLQGAGDLIKCAKELWSKKRITLAVTSLNGDTLRMNVDNEASRIIQEGIKQTLTTLINQAKTKRNTQVITSVLGALLRAGYSLSESINRMYQLLDTEKTVTISSQLAKKSIGLMLDGRINKWHSMNLCPNYSEEEITYEIMTLVGIGKGNTLKRCKLMKVHQLFAIDTKCPKCNFVKD